MYKLPTSGHYILHLTASYYYTVSRRDTLQFMRGVYYEETYNPVYKPPPKPKCINSVGIVYFLAIFIAILDHPTLFFLIIWSCLRQRHLMRNVYYTAHC